MSEHKKRPMVNLNTGEITYRGLSLEEIMLLEGFDMDIEKVIVLRRDDHKLLIRYDDKEYLIRR